MKIYCGKNSIKLITSTEVKDFAEISPPLSVP